MTNKFKQTFASILLMLAASSYAQTAQPKLKLSETVYDMPTGDIRPLLAVAASEGKAMGKITGQAAKQIEQQFGPGRTVMVKVVRTSELVDGCPKVIATYYEPGSNSTQEIPFKVCPKGKK